MRNVAPSTTSGARPGDVSDSESDLLVVRWIEPHPHRPGSAEVVIRDSKIPVYALVAYYLGSGEDVERVARDYRVPVEAAQAALAYYRRHRAVIEDRIAANAA
jgi:uncharacterized protein (DUF433 family)